MSGAAAQRMVDDRRVIVVRAARGDPLGPQHVEGIDAVSDLDVMPLFGERVGEAADGDPIPTEVVRRVERRDHTKTQWPGGSCRLALG